MVGSVANDGATNIGAADSMDGTLIRLKAQQKKEEAAKSERSKASIAQIEAAEGGYSKPAPEFKPTAETASGLMGLMSLVAAAGGILGGKGRTSGLMAINAASGMMEGYNKGRSELYEQQRQMFDEHMKSWEQNRKLVKEAFDRALRIAPTNLTLAQETLNRDLIALDLKPLAAINKTSGPMAAHATFRQVDSTLEEELKKYRQKLGPKATTSDLITEYEATKADERAKAAAEKAALDRRKELAQTQLEEQKLSGGGLTAVERKAETDREDLAKALKADFDRTKQEPVIKDEKLLGAYKKLFPEAPYRTSDKQTIDSDLMSDTAIASRVDRYLGGDKSAGSRFGVSALGQKNQNKFEEALAQEMKSRGISGQQLAVKMAEYEGIKAEERALGTRTAYIELASQELNKLIPTLEQASANVPRGSFIPVNRLLQTGESSLSEPSLIKLRTAINGVKQAYVKALTPIGTPTDYLRQSADDLFGPAVDNEGIKAALDQMKIEVNAALTAPDAVKESLERRYGGKSSTAAAPAPASATPAVGGAKTLPAEAVSKLKEGVHTKFSNGETWTLTNGVPTQVQ